MKNLRDADPLYLEWEMRTCQDYYAEWEVWLLKHLTADGFGDAQVWEFIYHPENFLGNTNWPGGSPRNDPRFDKFYK